MNQFISIVNQFYLVIYTDENSCKYIDTRDNPKIKIVIKPLEQFYNFSYKNFWIENHIKNVLLNNYTSWELNMLWSEKIWFVKDTIERKYYETKYYGWCDIGYFRNINIDLSSIFLSNWPNKEKINDIQKDKILYGCINNDDEIMNKLSEIINNKTPHGLPSQEISSTQKSIAGGFFILHKDKISWWAKTYDSKLQLYFKNKYLVKDDQIILVDCILSNLDNFILFREENPQFNNWFMFQRILC
jgi:hypothetical protein